MTLEKISRMDGIVSNAFEEGTPKFDTEYRRLRDIYSDERGIAADNDFREALLHGQFATAGFLYRLV